ncbi:unnamed protein product [Blepharisma stoltei]|uniref:Uncharacterized protein n=1 Tax=Blepharisma stoltei TaxID=1481888 RepID=A0AAU9JLI0_9CILI|nr:unnamed protein product [Blepharisma stoltei]
MSCQETQSSSMLSQEEISSKTENICHIENCKNGAHAICKCRSPSVFLCKDHILSHLEIASDIPHQTDFFYIKLDPKDNEYIADIILQAKVKLQSDYEKILKVSSEVIQSFTSKITQHISKIKTLQNAYISALESVISAEKISREAQTPIFQELQKDLQKFKSDISNVKWFSFKLDSNGIMDEIDNFCRIQLNNQQVFKFTGLKDEILVYEKSGNKESEDVIIEFEEVYAEKSEEEEEEENRWNYDSVDYEEGELRDFYEEEEEDTYEEQFEEQFEEQYDPWDDYEEDYGEDEELYVRTNQQESYSEYSDEDY